MDNDDLQERMEKLVQFLATRKDLPEYNIKTVVEMIQRLAKYEKDLEAANRDNRKVRDEMAMLADPMGGYERGRNRRNYEPGYPQMIEIPANARAVEIKL